MRYKIRIGIIGLGYMGNIHLSKLLLDERCLLSAVYDCDKKRYKRLKDRNIIKCDSFEDLREYIDAVVIASPSITHRDYLEFFLSNNIHCLCEKPPVINSKELERFIRLADKRSLVFNVVMPERENPVVKFIVNKARGKGYVFQSDRISPFVGRSTDISVLYDIMIHDIDILLKTISLDIKRINATGLSLLTDQIDILNVRIEYDNGCFAILNASRLAYEKKRKIRLFFKGGYISADLIKLGYRFIEIGKKEVKSYENIIDEKNVDPISIIDRDFVDSVLGNKRQSRFSASTMLRTIKFCNLIEKSIVCYKAK